MISKKSKYFKIPIKNTGGLIIKHLIMKVKKIKIKHLCLNGNLKGCKNIIKAWSESSLFNEADVTRDEIDAEEI